MEQYISKSALIAEIEKAIDSPAPSHDQQCPWEDGYYGGLYKAESIIDTLEVKGVDLEKEFFDWYYKNRDYNASILYERYGTISKKLAKHFFELGLGVQLPVFIYKPSPQNLASELGLKAKGE